MPKRPPALCRPSLSVRCRDYLWEQFTWALLGLMVVIAGVLGALVGLVQKACPHRLWRRAKKGPDP